EPTVRTLRSSGFGIDLQTSLAVAKGVATIVGGVKMTLDMIAKWRHLRKQAEELGVDPEVAEKLGAQGKKKLEDKIDELEAEIFQHTVVTNEGRLNELRSGVRVRIRGVAARMERGFNFEVRTALPPSADQKQKEMAVPITALSKMRFERIEGPPLLELPEGDGPDADDGVSKKSGIGKKKKSAD
ncbi:MAG TPA: hypothetical protein VG871_00350, partial [Vicinamibacterales bacterium]|nr:hypothetical protein [Vicinamibacterales bacterium]